MKGKRCYITLFKGALVGGLMMFLYFSASWMLLPWHKNTLMSFKNEKAVAATIAGNVNKSGIYVLPNMKTVKEETKPFAFVAVSVKGVDAKTMKAQLYKQLIFCLFAGLLLTKLLKKSCGGGCCPVMFSVLLGLMLASFHHLPNMVWYQFPWKYTLVGMLDDILATTLAGIFIAKIVLGIDIGMKCKK